MRDPHLRSESTTFANDLGSCGHEGSETIGNLSISAYLLIPVPENIEPNSESPSKEVKCQIS